MFYLITGLLGAALVAADQWSKAWALRVLEPVGTMPAICGIIDYTFLPNGNNGAAWGIFAGKQTLLVLVTGAMMLAILAAMLFYRRRLSRPEFVALTLVLAGGIGNLIDRVGQGYVVDFIQFSFWKTFPIFNVADICVTTGVALLVLCILFANDKKEKSREAA